MRSSSFTTQQIAFLGGHAPRQCGIATFTTALSQSIAEAFPKVSTFVTAVNDRAEGYDYPSIVRFEMEIQDLASYRRAAEFFNLNNIEVISVQHEFGIYGGESGEYLLEFLKTVHAPVVMTLHTVLREPNKKQFELMRAFDERCQRFVVMAQKGKEFLETIYNVAPEKIDLIPHGVIDLPFIDPNFYKDLFNVEGKSVLLTFGLLSPNKGIEYVIQALPAILKKNPNFVYFILGVTHPHQFAAHGEAYRDQLISLAKKCGVSDHVVFFNQFVNDRELKEFIGAADIYITPYCNEAQITSGTLSYTFGAGKAIVSTPYWHAQELLAHDRGILVPFRNAEAIAEGVNHLLSDPSFMTAMRKRAWKAGREMIWPVVAHHYMESFEKARSSFSIPDQKEKKKYPSPALKLDHLKAMSDQTGIFQHAIYNIPNFQEGYCVDDNARAFILTLLLQEKAPNEMAHLATSYLAFLWHAFDATTGRFHNFMNYERHWIDTQGSEDSHARVLWATGMALHRSKNKDHRHLCALLFERSLPVVKTFTSPRAWAFTLLGIHEYLQVFRGDRKISQTAQLLIEQLTELYQAAAKPQWSWFEACVTYDNAILSHALIVNSPTNSPAAKIGLTSLRWLLKAQMSHVENFSPVGCHGFWQQGKEKPSFDQQPLEAYSMVSACLAAHATTGDIFWKKAAQCCFEWFLGRNDLGLSLYDPATGGCHDALLPHQLNANQGAESTLAFWLAHAEISRAFK